MPKDIDQRDARVMRRYWKALQAVMVDYLDPANKQRPERFVNAVLEIADDYRLVRAVRGGKRR